jgi:outer membrane lipoprotein-sorting protein
MTSTLTRRSLALALAALPLPALAQRAAPALSAADQALVNRAAAYLQGLSEAKARFVQTDARGAQSTGALYL